MWQIDIDKDIGYEELDDFVTHFINLIEDNFSDHLLYLWFDVRASQIRCDVIEIGLTLPFVGKINIINDYESILNNCIAWMNTPDEVTLNEKNDQDLNKEHGTPHNSPDVYVKFLN